MHISTKSKEPMNKKVAFVALGISLIGHMTMSPCLAVSLSPKKQTALQYEVYSKLGTGAGPQTNDLIKQDAQLDSSTAAATPDAGAPAVEPVAANKPSDLSPITMDEGQPKEADSEAEPGVLRAKVQRDQAALSGPIEQTEQFMKPKSIKSEKALSKDSKDREAVANTIKPAILVQTEEEQQNQSDVKFNAEKIELSDLWDSTLGRSQDIQFVMNKLMPSNKSGKTANVMMKALSTCVFGGMSMMTMMAPNMGAQMGANMGASMMMQALNGVDAANKKKANLSETESIMLYKIVRDTANQLVENFRNYKLELGDLERTNDQLTRLQDMVKEVRATQSPVEQIKLESILMEKQSEIEKKTAVASRYRQALVDLSGTDAVAKLDKQLEADKVKAEEAGVIVNTPAPEKSEAAPVEAAPVVAAEAAPAESKVEAKPAVKAVAKADVKVPAKTDVKVAAKTDAKAKSDKKTQTASKTDKKAANL